jgi:hypothetical protein
MAAMLHLRMALAGNSSRSEMMGNSGRCTLFIMHRR